MSLNETFLSDARTSEIRLVAEHHGNNAMAERSVIQPAKRGSNTTLMLQSDPAEFLAILQDEGVAELYPDFRFWFFDKVVPGLSDGSRVILRAAMNEKTVGFAVCKRDNIERKLCTLWVSPNTRKVGVGSELARAAFQWLGTTHPLFTVSEEQLSLFEHLLRRWEFCNPVAYKNLYRPGKTEYIYNGPLCIKSH